MTCLTKCTWAVCVLVAGLSGFAQIGEAVRPNPASLEVVVTDTDDRPVPGAEVTWSATEATPTQARRILPEPKVLQTDLNGRCSIELPFGGSFRVAVRRDGYLDAGDLSQREHVETLEVERGKTVKLFVDLVRSASFRGTVYLEDGSRVPEAIVRLQPAALSWTGTIRGAVPKWLMARTDAQGNFVFPVVPPAQYGMWIAPPARVVNESLKVNDRGQWTGYGTIVWHTSVEELRLIIPVEVAPGEDVRGYNVVLRKIRVYPFQGALREWSGEPILHARVAIRADTEVPVTLLEPRAVNALTGDFDFPALPADHYSLLVYRDDAPDAPPYAIPLETGEGKPDVASPDPNQQTRYAVSVPPWVPVTGKVTVLRPSPAAAPDPQPLTGTPAPVSRNPYTQPVPVLVSLIPASPGVDARTDAMPLKSSPGSNRNSMGFPSVMVPPGDYWFIVEVPEPWYVVSARRNDEDLLKKGILSLAARQYDNPVQFVVEIRQGGTALAGTVVDDQSQPVPHGAMCAMAAEPARRQQPGGAFCVHADSEGVFQSRWMSPGEWLIWAFKKMPREDPASSVFQDRYGRRSQTITAPENGELGVRSILAIE